jgi:hypothetical protein
MRRSARIAACKVGDRSDWLKPPFLAFQLVENKYNVLGLPFREV